MITRDGPNALKAGHNPHFIIIEPTTNEIVMLGQYDIAVFEGGQSRPFKYKHEFMIALCVVLCGSEGDFEKRARRHQPGAGMRGHPAELYPG